MSTTVNYKGQTLTTVNNETKTLTTQGKYLEANIILTDVTQSSTLGTKTITSNGTYNASSDSLDGYSQVTVNVPTPSPSLQTKSVSCTPTESAQSASVTADSGYDGLDTVNVSVGAISPNYVGSGITRMSAQTVTPTEQTQTVSTNGKYMTGDITVNPIPSSYIVPSGSQSITANGTYDVTALAEVDVNVSGGGSTEQIARGEVTYTSTYNTTGNRLVCALSDIGFTPKRFYLNIKDRSTVSGIASVMLRTSYEVDNGGNYLRVTTRFTNTSGSLGSAQNGTNWTTQSSYTLYNNGTNIYFRTTSAYIISANTTYEWLAIG